MTLGRDKCASWAGVQAWAQNLGHESLTTTFGSYGKVAPREQGELVRNAGAARKPDDKKLERLLALVEGMSEGAEPGARKAISHEKSPGRPVRRGAQ